MKFIPKEIKKNVNITHVSPLREFFFFTAVLLCIGIAAYQAMGYAVDLLIPYIPPEIEKRLGRQMINQFSISKNRLIEKDLQRHLDRLVEKLPDLNRKRYKVVIIEGKESNAFAFPGGYIGVISGLIKDIGSQNELSFVLAHELGHFYNNDHMRMLGRGIVLLGLSSIFFGQDSGITDFFIGILVNVQMKSSREYESKADIFAVDLINKLYGHVGGAADFLYKMTRRDKRGKWRHYFSTHPHPLDRIDSINRYIKEKGFLKKDVTGAVYKPT